jgi:TRAP-type C4-dicarboxylate transport system permease small subunit
MPRPLVTTLEAASAALLALLTVNASVELFAWMIWHRSFAALDEIQALVMVWFGMLSAAYCLARGSHLAVDIVVRRLVVRHRGSRLILVLARVPSTAVVVFGLLLSIYGWKLVGAIGNTLPATGWSASLQYQPVAVIGLLIAGIGLWQLFGPPSREQSESGAIEVGGGSDPE